MRANRTFRFLLIAVLLFAALATYAQLGPPPPPPPPPPPDDGAPLGGEVFLLIGAGAIYALNKFREKEPDNN